MRTIYWYSYFVISLIFKLPKLILLKLSKDKYSKEEYENKINNAVKQWVKKQIKNAKVTVNIEGINNIPKENVLFVSNHQSNFDIAILILFIEKNKGFVGKKEMLKFPLLNMWMKELKCIFIDRGDIKKSAKSILKGINILKEGYSLVVFPEGTRSKSKKMNKFKPGSFKLATKSKVPIVPITINNSYKIMEHNNYKIRPSNVFLKIHPAIYTNKLTNDQLKELPNKIENIIKSAIK